MLKYLYIYEVELIIWKVIASQLVFAKCKLNSLFRIKCVYMIGNTDVVKTVGFVKRRRIASVLRLTKPAFTTLWRAHPHFYSNHIFIINWSIYPPAENNMWRQSHQEDIQDWNVSAEDIVFRSTMRQNSYAFGVSAPKLWGRCDLSKQSRQLGIQWFGMKYIPWQFKYQWNVRGILLSWGLRK